MSTNNHPGVFLVAAAIVLQSTAAALSKQAGIESAANGFSLAIINPWYLISLAALALQMILWILALRVLPLSTAYPCMSLALPLNLALSVLIFGEMVYWNHIVGMTVLTVGVVLVSKEG